MQTYRITHHSQESECDQCGGPSYVGDTATEHEEHVFCSRSCARLWSAENARPSRAIDETFHYRSE